MTEIIEFWPFNLQSKPLQSLFTPQGQRNEVYDVVLYRDSQTDALGGGRIFVWVKHIKKFEFRGNCQHVLASWNLSWRLHFLHPRAFPPSSSNVAAADSLLFFYLINLINWQMLNWFPLIIVNATNFSWYLLLSYLINNLVHEHVPPSGCANSIFYFAH